MSELFALSNACFSNEGSGLFLWSKMIPRSELVFCGKIRKSNGIKAPGFSSGAVCRDLPGDSQEVSILWPYTGINPLMRSVSYYLIRIA